MMAAQNFTKETLGDNVVLYLGDCLEVLPTLQAGSIDGVVADPPYSSGGQFRGDRTQKTVAKYVHGSSKDTFRINFTGDNRDQRAYLAWCSLWMLACHRAAHSGAVFCCFSDWRQVPVLTDAIQAGGWVWRNMATWWKPGVRMQKGRFSQSAEYILYGSYGIPANGEYSPQNVYKSQPVNGRDKIHIAEKPIDVIKWIIGVTPKGAIILDPFMGGGAAGVACVQTGRKYIGIEIDPNYFNVAGERIQEAQQQMVLPI